MVLGYSYYYRTISINGKHCIFWMSIQRKCFNMNKNLSVCLFMIIWPESFVFSLAFELFDKICRRWCIWFFITTLIYNGMSTRRKQFSFIDTCSLSDYSFPIATLSPCFWACMYQIQYLQVKYLVYLSFPWIQFQTL